METERATSLLRAICGAVLILGACAPLGRASTAASAASAGAATAREIATRVDPGPGLWPLDLGAVMIDDRDLPDDLYRYEQRDYGALGAAVGDEKKARSLIARGFLGGQERIFHGVGPLAHAGMSTYVSVYLTDEGARAALLENAERTAADADVTPLPLRRRIGDDVRAFVERAGPLDLFDTALMVYGRQGRFSFGLRVAYQDGDIPQALIDTALEALESQARRLAALDR